MRKLVLFMHTTLDGFVAGPGGEMDWIHVDEDIFDYAGSRTSEADTALYGRNTYEMMEAYWPTAANSANASRHDIEHSAWYNKVPKVVLSKSLEGQSIPNATIISDNIPDSINSLKFEPGKDILIFGSPTAVHTLIEHDLIDDYWVFVNPVLLGEGIAMFKSIKERLKLSLLEAKAFTSGVVCLHYERQRN